MTVVATHKNTDELTLTIVAQIDATLERTWQLWADPRQLERWWGPPEYPATVVDHDLEPEALVTYFMTGPEGEHYHGWWRIISVDAPTSLTFRDGFADDDGNPSDEMPSMINEVLLEPEAGGTRMTIVSTFPSVEDMEQLLEMGAADGMSLAIGQIADLLAEDG